MSGAPPRAGGGAGDPPGIPVVLEDELAVACDGFIGDPRILGAVRKAKKAYQDMEKEAPDREEATGKKASTS